MHVTIIKALIALSGLSHVYSVNQLLSSLSFPFPQFGKLWGSLLIRTVFLHCPIKKPACEDLSREL